VEETVWGISKNETHTPAGILYSEMPGISFFFCVASITGKMKKTIVDFYTL
jgi:hypothetical protein